uniref:Secreted protein n=1 Tax=Psorophora albipes TaxID=869069 RepID=T1DFJ0_9DIPT
MAGLVVLLDAAQEIVTAAGWVDVLDADVDALGQDVSADALVHDDTEGVLGDVVHATGLTVVGLVGHTLVHGTVTLDVDEVTGLVDLHVGRQRDGTVLPEGTGEHVPGTTTITLRVSHFACLVCK